MVRILQLVTILGLAEQSEPWPLETLALRYNTVTTQLTLQELFMVSEKAVYVTLLSQSVCLWVGIWHSCSARCSPADPYLS